MSVKEAAEKLGRTEGAVKGIRFRKQIGVRAIHAPERFSKKEKILRIHSLMAQHNIKLYGED